MRRALRYAVPAAALTLVLTACSGGEDEPTANPSGSSTPTSTSTSTPPATSTPAEPSPSGSGGTAEDPVVLEAGADLLDWRAVGGPVASTVTRGGDWTLTVNEAGTEAEISGADSGSAVGTTARTRISDALLDDRYAVVVVQDRREVRPSSATVVELGTGNQFTVDGSSDVPTVNGGTWALGQGRLLHATTSGGAYCIASVDLATQRSTLGWCAPERHGFNTAQVTPSGDSLTTFDDSRPACRTVAALSGTRIAPFPDVAKCRAWEGILVEDGAVWSVLPNEKQVENARLVARSGRDWFDLGPGTSGTLRWCGDAAYFVRDPQRDGDPAALMRWDAGRGLDVVYRSPGGPAILSAPRCGGDAITLTALAEAGDEQVSAAVR